MTVADLEGKLRSSELYLTQRHTAGMYRGWGNSIVLDLSGNTRQVKEACLRLETPRECQTLCGLRSDLGHSKQAFRTDWLPMKPWSRRALVDCQGTYVT